MQKDYTKSSNIREQSDKKKEQSEEIHDHNLTRKTKRKLGKVRDLALSSTQLSL